VSAWACLQFLQQLSRWDAGFVSLLCHLSGTYQYQLKRGNLTFSTSTQCFDQTPDLTFHANGLAPGAQYALRIAFYGAYVLRWVTFHCSYSHLPLMSSYLSGAALNADVMSMMLLRTWQRDRRVDA
jgi:hypothetical protein